jgi:hypothetical protein
MIGYFITNSLGTFRLVLHACLLIVPISCASAEQVTLTVRVVDHANTPVSDAPIEYGVGYGPGTTSRFGRSDGNGELTHTFEVVNNNRLAFGRLWHGKSYERTPEEKAEDSARFEELLASTFSPRLTSSTVPLGQTTHVLTIQLQQAVNVTLRFTNTGRPYEPVNVSTREGRSFKNIGFESTGTLNGVRKGVATHLFAVSNMPEVWILPLTAAQTSSSRNLGSIAFPEPTCTAPVSLTMTNHTDLWLSPIFQLRNMASFIKKDDGRVFVSFVNRTTNLTVEKTITSNDIFKLPPGEYYVVPGVFGTKIHWKVYDLVKAGQQAALDAVQIPTITAADGQTATATIDAKKVVEDIQRLP